MKVTNAFLLLFLTSATLATAQTPLITSFTPTQGYPGTTVTIQGTGFQPTPSNNAVFLGGKQLEVNSATSSTLTVVVPTGIASVSPFKVVDLVSNKSASSLRLSNGNFIATLPGGMIQEDTYQESNFTLGNAPFNAAHGDFNGDGLMDIVTANASSNNVSILIRNSANTGFNGKVDYPVGPTPRMVIVTDFNGDGRLDIATASHGTSKQIDVLIRNQNPVESNGFTSETSLIGPYQLTSISAGDVNGDGMTEIIAAHYNNNSIAVYRRNASNSGFVSEATYAVGRSISNSTVGDLNGDGKLDVAVCNTGNNTVSILYRNTTNTGFFTPSNLTVGASRWAIAIADFNGDGKADLVTGNHEGFNVSVLLRNTTNSGFNASINYPVGAYVQWVVPSDFNNDGKIDLALNVFRETDPNEDNVLLMVNNGNGTFQSPFGYHVDGLVRAVTVADFNADGQDDIFAPNYSGTSGKLFESNLACWKGAVNTAWDNTGNWWGGKLPTTSSDIRIFKCSQCPSVQTPIVAKRLTFFQASVVMNGNSFDILNDASIIETEIQGASALQAANIFNFNDNHVRANISITKTGGQANTWTGNNEFKGELKIINNSSATISTNTTVSNVVIK